MWACGREVFVEVFLACICEAGTEMVGQIHRELDSVSPFSKGA